MTTNLRCFTSHRSEDRIEILHCPVIRICLYRRQRKKYGEKEDFEYSSCNWATKKPVVASCLTDVFTGQYLLFSFVTIYIYIYISAPSLLLVCTDVFGEREFGTVHVSLVWPSGSLSSFCNTKRSGDVLGLIC